MTDVEGGQVDLAQAMTEGGTARVAETLKGLPIALFGRSTCPYCIEAQSTLESAAAGLANSPVSVVWYDKLPQGGAAWDALKAETGQKTVPYVFVNGEFLGGCDDIKRLETTGALASKVHAAAAAHGLPSAAPPPRKKDGAPTVDSANPDSPAHSTGEDAHHHAAIMPDETFQDAALKPALGDGTPPAYPCAFWFPEVVDSNVIRLTAAQVVAVCVICIIWRTHTWAHYAMLGLALDGLARVLFGAGPSPLAQLARCAAAPFKPKFRPGVPKQFAAACGTFMATVATVLFFTGGYDPEEIIASCFLGVYAALAFLECSIDFCMGCVMFGWAVKFGLLPREVYTIGITTKPEAEYTYEEAVKRVELPEPQAHRLGYPGKPSSAIDVKYKQKLNDHDRQSWNVIKHVKAMHFTIVLGLAGLAVLWRAAALPSIGGAAGLSIPNATGDVLTIFTVVLYGVVGLLYAAKALKFPRKVAKEWMCPLRCNTFVIPPASLVLIAFATAGRFDGATTLAKVLFWIGAPATLALALYLAAARWITEPRSSEHINPAWLLPPTACFVCALVAPFLDPRYTEAAYLWFAAAVALALPTYVITFQRAVLFQEPDDRNRPLKWTWVSAWAVACAAQVVLAAATGPTGPVALGSSVMPFDFVSRLLYLAALALALVLAALYLTGHTSRLRFDASSWALAFPLEALAIATLLYAAAVPGSLTTGMAYAGLAVASVATLVLALHTVQSLLMGGIFVMDPKYGPLSQQILTHEAFRSAGERLKVAAAALEPSPKTGAVGGPALAAFALQFRRYRLAHAWHAHQEETVIFREFETYVPGLCSRQHKEHVRDEGVMERWAALLEAAEAGAQGGDTGAKEAAQALGALRAEIPAFVDQFEEHLQGEEAHLQRAGRKQMNIDLQKAMLRRIWEATPPEVWSEFLPFVVANLPMHGQRVKFVRCWATWALPERAQLIGRYIALGVEAPVWERLVQQVPEIIPRGAPGWTKYG